MLTYGLFTYLLEH